MLAQLFIAVAFALGIVAPCALLAALVGVFKDGSPFTSDFWSA